MLKPYLISLPGSGLADEVFLAESRDAARLNAAQALVDIGHFETIKDALHGMKTKRYREEEKRP